MDTTQFETTASGVIEMYSRVRLRFNILVIGPKKSGKTLLAGKLGARLGAQVVETSDVLVEEGAVLLASMFPTQYPTLAEARERLLAKGDAERVCLYALGDMMTALKPTCLIEGAVKDADVRSCPIVVGPRRKIELEGWFGNTYQGWKHTEDILVELIDPKTSDAQYELAGWAGSATRHRQAEAVKFKVPASPERFDAIAEDLAAMIRGIL